MLVILFVLFVLCTSFCACIEYLIIDLFQTEWIGKGMCAFLTTVNSLPVISSLFGIFYAFFLC